jgi:hypothetical protein
MPARPVAHSSVLRYDGPRLAFVNNIVGGIIGIIDEKNEHHHENQ